MTFALCLVVTSLWMQWVNLSLRSSLAICNLNTVVTMYRVFRSRNNYGGWCTAKNIYPRYKLITQIYYLECVWMSGGNKFPRSNMMHNVGEFIGEMGVGWIATTNLHYASKSSSTNCRPHFPLVTVWILANTLARAQMGDSTLQKAQAMYNTLKRAGAKPHPIP